MINIVILVMSTITYMILAVRTHIVITLAMIMTMFMITNTTMLR